MNYDPGCSVSAPNIDQNPTLAVSRPNQMFQLFLIQNIQFGIINLAVERGSFAYPRDHPLPATYLHL